MVRFKRARILKPNMTIKHGFLCRKSSGPLFYGSVSLCDPGSRVFNDEEKYGGAGSSETCSVRKESLPTS